VVSNYCATLEAPRAAGQDPPGPGFPRLSELLGHLAAATADMRRGRDLGIRVELDLAECAFGTTRELTVDRMVACPGCGGYGRVRVSPCLDCNGAGWAHSRRTIKVRIPAGVADITQIQLPGEGDAGRGGGAPGDLFLEIAQRPHPIFERHGDDLHCTVFIPMVAAALGVTLSVDSLDGPAGIDIRPGTQSGQVVPLYGYGVRHLNRNGRGDLVVHVMVETPAGLDPAQRQLLSELAMLRGEEPPLGSPAPGQLGGAALAATQR
jgi:molecular chaperone DnaJ